MTDFLTSSRVTWLSILGQAWPPGTSGFSWAARPSGRECSVSKAYESTINPRRENINQARGDDFDFAKSGIVFSLMNR
jgi:hypothetical protein